MVDQLLFDRALVGTLLASRYELRAPVGRGGMGVVYEAVDRQLDRTVAVKVLRPELAADRRLLARFRREARTSARLAHHGIVAVHDVGENDGRAFIVMEFVAGRTLGAIVRDAGPLAPASAAGIGAEVADALAHAHARGVVHRDVAPGNVMVTPLGEIKVLDFGIARASRGSARSGSPTMHGTIAYVAPEQARGDAADQRADIYALGAVLYELLTGRPPFEAASTTELVRRLQVHEPAPIRSVAPEVPVPLEEIVHRCLAKDPGARFTRADELATALRDARRTPAVRAGQAAARMSSARSATVPLAPLPRTATLPTGSPVERIPRRRRSAGRTLTLVALALVVLGAGCFVVPALGLPGVVEPILHGPPPVPTPTNLTARTACSGWLSTHADLTWTPGGPSDGYEIWRSQPGDRAYELVARLPDWRTTSFTDAGLGVDVTYNYVLRAVHGPRISAPTREVVAPTPLLCLS